MKKSICLLVLTSLTACSEYGPAYDNVCDNPSLTEEQSRQAKCDEMDMSVSDASVEQDSAMQPDDMREAPQDMNLAKTIDLTATQEDDSLFISWENVEGAEFYEIKIDNQDWVRIGDTPGYLDSTLEHMTGTATLDTNEELVRDKVTLTMSNVNLLPSRERRYEVRAIKVTEVIAQGTVWASHQPTLIDATLSYSDQEGEWKTLANFTDPSNTLDDIEAPPNGDIRQYKATLNLSNGLSFDTDVVTGHRLAAIEVVIADERTCVLFNNKKIRCFGGSGTSAGHLGYEDKPARGGDLADLPTPYVNVGMEVEQLMLNGSVSCVLSPEKQVRCWGWRDVTGNINTSIFLGDEPGEMPPEPFTFNKPLQKLSSSSGGSTPCAITEAGEVTCWTSFNSFFSVLGYEDMTPRKIPPFEYVNVGRPVKEVVSLETGTCALALDDTVLCWGRWLLDQTIGDQPGTMPPPPLDIVAGNQKIISFSGGTDHVCVAVENSTQVYCWGKNNAQQLGHNDDDFVGNDLSEFPVRGVSLADASFVKQVVAGSSFSGWSCGLLDNGNVTCWGFNEDGRLGYVPDPNNDIRTRVSEPLDLGGKAVQIAAGSTHACALMRDGEVKCWGRNDFGQLGVGHTDIVGDEEGDMPPANSIIYE